MRGILQPAVSMVNATAAAVSSSLPAAAAVANGVANATSAAVSEMSPSLAWSLLDKTWMEYAIVIAAVVILLLDVTDFKSDALVGLLVPLVFLNMPHYIFHLVRSDVGLWIAFIILLAVLYTPPAYVPPPTNLWSALLLLHIVAPSFIVHLRGSLLGVFISFFIGVALLTQHARSEAIVYSNEGTYIKMKSQPVTVALLVVAIMPIVMFLEALI